MSGRSKNGRRLFRAAVRLHAYAAVRTNLSLYRAVFEAFLRLIYRIRQSRFVRSLRTILRLHWKFRLRLQPGFFISEEPPLLPAAFRLFFVAFWLLSHCLSTAAPLAFPVTSGCLSVVFRLLPRRFPVVIPTPSGCLPGCLPAAVPLQPFLTYADDSGTRIL